MAKRKRESACEGRPPRSQSSTRARPAPERQGALGQAHNDGEGAAVKAERAGPPLTAEQEEILGHAAGPGDIPVEGKVLRITAGAGAGKTTTLKELGKRLIDRGHRDIVYTTFNKAAAKDAEERLGSFAKCRTLHSLAFEAVGLGSEGERLAVGSDSDLDSLVAKKCKKDIDRLLSAMPRGSQDEEAAYKRERKTVAFYIRKTLVQFMHSNATVDEGFDSSKWNTTYYPARLYHKEDRRGIPSDCGSFYTDAAAKVFKLVRPSRARKVAGRLILYDAIMKEAQLRGCVIPGSALLVDEAQDCNACQVAWVLASRPGKFVALVGDAVQTIYSFRGAKSQVPHGSARVYRLHLDAELSLWGKHRVRGQHGTVREAERAARGLEALPRGGRGLRARGACRLHA